MKIIYSKSLQSLNKKKREKLIIIKSYNFHPMLVNTTQVAIHFTYFNLLVTIMIHQIITHALIIVSVLQNFNAQIVIHFISFATFSHAFDIKLFIINFTFGGIVKSVELLNSSAKVPKNDQAHQ